MRVLDPYRTRRATSGKGGEFAVVYAITIVKCALQLVFTARLAMYLSAGLGTMLVSTRSNKGRLQRVRAK